MPFLMICDDITKVKADMIVNPSDIKLTEGRGISHAIFLSLAERKLVRTCKELEQCKAGEEEKFLYNTYQLSLKLARRKKCKSIAFPLPSSGDYGLPKEKALEIAVSAFNDFLMKHDMLIYLVLSDRDSFPVKQKLFSEVEEYIDDHYTADNDENIELYALKEEVFEPYFRELPLQTEEEEDKMEAMPMMASLPAPAMDMPMPSRASDMSSELKKTKRSLDNLINNLDESFSQMLLRLIDERGLKDSVVYKKANIDRRHFSKIRNNINYLPTKRTVFCFAIALELSLDETKDLMNRAGYSLSGSSKFDVIMSYFLENNIYDIFEINEVLFMYEQPILGE